MVRPQILGPRSRWASPQQAPNQETTKKGHAALKSPPSEHMWFDLHDLQERKEINSFNVTRLQYEKHVSQSEKEQRDIGSKFLLRLPILRF